MLKNTYFFIDTLIISVFLSLCQPVYAALISQDYSTHGDNGLTLDTQSGLYWLDFGYTRGLSIEQVQAGSGGWNQQFRYATLPEVQLLFVHAGLNLETSVEPYCGRLLLESEGFFAKIRLTVGVATAFAEFLQKSLHLQRIRRPRYGFN